MKERIFSGAILLLFLAAVVLFNNSMPIAFNAALALIAALAIYELIKALNMQKKWHVTVPSLLTAVAALFVFDSFYLFAIYTLYAAVMFAGLIATHRQTNFKDIAVVLSMVFMIPLAMRTLIDLRSLSQNHGMFYVLIAIFAAWASDVGAYFTGTFLGKHKLSPNISPKKTVEGLIGGILFNIGIALFCGFIFTNIWYKGNVVARYEVLALIGLVGSLTSVLGDLSFSLIKRSCHIKDFGQVIPGHGGILDRFDSVIFTAPFIYILVSFLPIVG